MNIPDDITPTDRNLERARLKTTIALFFDEETISFQRLWAAIEEALSLREKEVRARIEDIIIRRILNEPENEGVLNAVLVSIRQQPSWRE